MCVLRKLFVLSMLPVLLVFLHGGTQADGGEVLSWQRLTTRYTVIHYQSVHDLGKFCRKVKHEPRNWGLRALFSTDRSDMLKDMVATKTDCLFEKVQGVLGMLKKMEKIHIRLYRNKAQLDDEYEQFYQKPCPIRAWYRYETRTVYIQANDIEEGVLAHELTHAIVDHYLADRPPRATAEILARYVDKNLEKFTPVYDVPGPSQIHTD